MNEQTEGATISLCMIVRNEHQHLARCLQSVLGVVDEIIVVDTGSQDDTKEIARRYTERVYDFVWQDDFSRARNFSFSKATMDFILWMDADDVLEAEDALRLLALKKTIGDTADVVMLPYHVGFSDSGEPTLTYDRERLLRRSRGFVWRGAVHEAISPAGRILHADAAICHRKLGAGDPDRNLRIYEKLLAKGEQLGPREQYYYARELCDHGRFEAALAAFEAFLSRPDGWVENRIDACRLAARCLSALGKPDEAQAMRFRSFAMDLPRAETCCEIGAGFMEARDYRAAAYWYERAMSCRPDSHSGAFVQPECYDYVPLLQLCVCYDRMGDSQRAQAFNERVGERWPEDPSYLYNKTYFEGRRQAK